MANVDISGIEYIEFYVGNLVQATHFYKEVLGFTPIARRDYKNDIRDGTSILLKQHKINIILTSAITPNSPIAEHVYNHGDGVKDIALSTKDLEKTYLECIRRGATSVMSPTIVEDDNCKIIKASIATFGSTQHTFIERLDNSTSLPNFKAYENIEGGSVVGLQEIDHVAICVAEGSLGKWGDFYKNIFEFTEYYHENIYTGNSGMDSSVVQNSLGNVRFTLLEPVSGVKRSQIQDFLDFYKADGVQHIAFLTKDITRSVRALRNVGIDFLSVPKTYYAKLPERINNLQQDITTLEELQILADRDKDGFLFQIFSKVIQSRPTFFIEIIQRQGTQGFGSGNIKALFEAVEMEQRHNEL